MKEGRIQKFLVETIPDPLLTFLFTKCATKSILGKMLWTGQKKV